MEKSHGRERPMDKGFWSSWIPRERATLLFIFREGEILLIHKKRGLGAGKISGPGGRLEPGETPLQAALREVQEEVGVTPTGVSERGVLKFQFCDGYSLEATVFSATGLLGEPRETGEAIPMWVPLDRIPYDRMWADDRIWLPECLAGHRFSGRFFFDGDQMLEHHLDVEAGGQGNPNPVTGAPARALPPDAESV